MSWSLIPRDYFGFNDDFFTTPFHKELRIPSLLTEFDKETNEFLTRSSPKYEIMEDDKNFKIAIDVPGVKVKDLNIEVGHGGRVLNIKGERTVTRGENISTSKFEKSFTMSSHVDVKGIKANLSDGVLVIDAPKFEKHEEIVSVPITEHPNK